MTSDEILQIHAANQGMDPKKLRGQVKDFLEAPATQIFQQGACLFLVKFENNIVYFHIFNGGNTSGYLRALRLFVDFMKKFGFKKIAMRVDDKDQSSKIAASAGVLSSSYEYIGGKVDPHLMIMEI